MLRSNMLFKRASMYLRPLCIRVPVKAGRINPKRAQLTSAYIFSSSVSRQGARTIGAIFDFFVDSASLIHICSQKVTLSRFNDCGGQRGTYTFREMIWGISWRRTTWFFVFSKWHAGKFRVGTDCERALIVIHVLFRKCYGLYVLFAFFFYKVIASTWGYNLFESRLSQVTMRVQNRFRTCKVCSLPK